MEVPLDANNPWLASAPWNYVLPVLRTEADAANHGENGPPNYRSTSTHWWDASQIYCTDPKASAQNRSGVGGQLRLTNDGRLPFDPANPDNPL